MEMKPTMIAIIASQGITQGYRLAGMSDGKISVKNVPVASIANVIASDANAIENMTLVNGEPTSSNGTLARYPKYDTVGTARKIENNLALTILTQYTENDSPLGYLVCSGEGLVKKINTEDLVYTISNNLATLSNGKVVTTDNTTFVSSISGTFPKEEIKRKNKNADSVMANISINLKDAKTVAKNVRVDVNNTVSESDIYKNMSKQQIKIVEDYYIWYTVELYKSFTKSLILNLAPNKAEKLGVLRGEKDWNFGGVIDKGFQGAARCALGHPVRYAYYAVPRNDADRSKAIIFGETCSSDFFQISKEDMAKLLKTRRTMSEEIEYIVRVVDGGTLQDEIQESKLIYQVMRKLIAPENGTDVKFVGVTLRNIFLNFTNNGLPLPCSLIKLLRKSLDRNYKDTWLAVFPQHADAIEEITKNQYRSSFLDSYNRMLRHACKNRLDGQYAYDPNDDTVKKQRDEGDYNKQARYSAYRLDKVINRDTLLSKKMYTYENMDAALNVVSKSIKAINYKAEKIESLEKMCNVSEVLRDTSVREFNSYINEVAKCGAAFNTLDKYKVYANKERAQKYPDVYNVLMNAMLMENSSYVNMSGSSIFRADGFNNSGTYTPNNIFEEKKRMFATVDMKDVRDLIDSIAEVIEADISNKLRATQLADSVNVETDLLCDNIEKLKKYEHKHIYSIDSCLDMYKRKCYYFDMTQRQKGLLAIAIEKISEYEKEEKDVRLGDNENIEEVNIEEVNVEQKEKPVQHSSRSIDDLDIKLDLMAKEMAEKQKAELDKILADKDAEIEELKKKLADMKRVVQAQPTQQHEQPVDENLAERFSADNEQVKADIAEVIEAMNDNNAGLMAYIAKVTHLKAVMDNVLRNEEATLRQARLIRQARESITDD